MLCVVDADKQTVRSVVDYYFEGGHSYLFAEQVIIFSTQGREHCHGLIIEAIKRAVQAAFTSHQPAAKLAAETPQPKAARAHEDDDDTKATSVKEKEQVHDTDQASDAEVASSPEDELRAALLAKYGSAKQAFKSFNKDGVVTKREWKRIIKKTVAMKMTGDDMKLLRKGLPKTASLREFCAFVGGSEDLEEEMTTSEATDSRFAELPSEVSSSFVCDTT